MFKIIVLVLFATFVFASNPNIYRALGDVIYNNVENIEKLKNISKYSQYEKQIDSYVKEVYNTKDIGYAIEAGDKSIDKKEYLSKIRKLAKTNDFFYRIVNNSFKSSIVSEDNDMFLKTINSGLIDTDRYKSKILNYYFIHCNDMNTTGVIQKYLDEDEKLRKQQLESKKVFITKKQLQEAKIKRIREKDKEKQEALQKALEDELLRKKEEIRKEQIKELSIPN